MRLHDVADEYFESMDFNRLEPNTKRTYRYWIDRIPDEATDSPNGLYKWLSEQTSSASTKNLALAIAKAVCKWGINNDFMALKQHVAKGIKRFRSTPAKPEGYTKEEIELICAEARNQPERVAALYLKILFWTGARVSEIMDLRWRDIDYKERLISIMGAKQREKNKLSRYCNMLPVVEDALAELREELKDLSPQGPDDFLFRLKLGKYNIELDRAGIRYRIFHIGKRLGIARALRQTRAGLATAMIKEGYTLTDVQHTLGHANSSTTEIYVRTPAKEKAKIFRGL